METYKRIVLNQDGDAPDWGVRENAAFHSIIDAISKGAASQVLFADSNANNNMPMGDSTLTYASGALTIGTSLLHSGDTNTYLNFPSGGDEILLLVGGATALNATLSGGYAYNWIQSFVKLGSSQPTNYDPHGSPVQTRQICHVSPSPTSNSFCVLAGCENPDDYRLEVNKYWGNSQWNLYDSGKASSQLKLYCDNLISYMSYESSGATNSATTTELWRIDKTGFMGVGTTSPQNMIHVSSSSHAAVGGSGLEKGIQFTDDVTGSSSPLNGAIFGIDSTQNTYIRSCAVGSTNKYINFITDNGSGGDALMASMVYNIVSAAFTLNIPIYANYAAYILGQVVSNLADGGNPPITTVSKVKCTNLNADEVDGVNIGTLTNAFVPYYNSTGTTLANSPLQVSGTYIGLGMTPTSLFTLYKAAATTELSLQCDGGQQCAIYLGNTSYPTVKGKILFNDTAATVGIGISTNLVVMGSSGSLTAPGAFGCNGATAQTAYASGGALAAYGSGTAGFDTGAHASALYAMVVAIRAALVANGIMS